MTRRPRLRRLAVVLLPALLLAACTAGPGAPPASVPASPAPSAATPLPSPSTPSAAPIGTPVTPGGPSGPIAVEPPITVQPVANLLNVHDVRAESVSATASGGRVTATVVWWSGPAPCSQLSEVHVTRAGSAFTLTVREGAAQLGVACPALAVHKQTTVDLGALPAGTYTVSATGVDTPASVSVPG